MAGKVLIDDWCKKEKLILIQGWTRDGHTLEDIANRIGISQTTLSRWEKDRPEIKKALKSGREVVDYKVENALLKSALGYKTKETTVRTLIRNGVAVENETITTSKEQAPNVSAIQCWLYNRRPDKWKNMNSRANIMEDLDEDSSVQITVTRAKQSELENNEDDDWTEEVNKSVSVRKPTEAEKLKKEKEEKRKRREERKAKSGKTKIEKEPEDLDWEGEDE